jgi:hypothetical protein
MLAARCVSPARKALGDLGDGFLYYWARLRASQGREEGRDKGRRESLRVAVETACELLGIEVDTAR